MRAGSLDRKISIQRPVSIIAADGTPDTAWMEVASVRAQVLELSTEEYLRAYGETNTMAVIFRTRWRAGVNTDCRIVHDGRALNIRETKEIGRRRGLELRCAEVRS